MPRDITDVPHSGFEPAHHASTQFLALNLLDFDRVGQSPFRPLASYCNPSLLERTGASGVTIQGRGPLYWWLRAGQKR
jgi:hypothetical protein